MDTILLERLENVGYDSSSLAPEQFSEALTKGPKSIVFTTVVAWLADQLVSFGDLEETVHATETAEDASSFLLELSSFLKELGCVNELLMSGNVNQRLANKQERVLLLEYLITELMACKITELKKPEDGDKLELTIHESSTAKCLKDMLVALEFPEPPENISAEQLFENLGRKLQKVIAGSPSELVGKPLFAGELSPVHWENLDTLQEDMNVEYKMRREMLLKRLDVTVQSFQWSDRIKAKEDQLNTLYHDNRNLLSSQPSVALAHLLAARDDLAIIEKTSNATVRKNTRSGVNKVIIGDVPDRGGRPQDQQPPPPEMPSWQKDRAPDGPSRGGRGGRGGGGGGFRDHKDASRNFGQNRDEPHREAQHFGAARQAGNYGDNRGGEYNRGGGARGGEYNRGGGAGGGGGRGGEYNRGGGGGGRGRGGRVQGGWNQRGRGGSHY